MIIAKTLDCRGPNKGDILRPHLSITVRTPSGNTPVTYGRGMNVGVGGRYTSCPIAPGNEIRRATLNELRRLDRIRITSMHEDYPGCVIIVQRSWHK